MSTINAQNVSGGQIWIDGYGPMLPDVTDDLPDSDQVQELIADGALDPDPDVIPTPSKTGRVSAKVKPGDTSTFLIDVHESDNPADYIGADGVARPLAAGVSLIDAGAEAPDLALGGVLLEVSDSLVSVYVGQMAEFMDS